MKLQIGQIAPDFTLSSHLGKDVTLVAGPAEEFEREVGGQKIPARP